MKSKKVALLMVFVSLIFVVSCDGFENYLVRKEEQSVIYLGYSDSVIDDPQNGQEKFNELAEKYDLPVIQLVKIFEASYREEVSKMIQAGELEAFCITKNLDNIQYYVNNGLIMDVTETVQNELSDIWHPYCEQACNVTDLLFKDRIYAIPARTGSLIGKMPAIMIEKETANHLNITGDIVDINDLIDKVKAENLKITTTGENLTQALIYSAGYKYITFDKLAYDPKVKQFVYVEQADEFIDIFYTITQLVKEGYVECSNYYEVDYETDNDILLYDYVMLRESWANQPPNKEYLIFLLDDPETITSYFNIGNGICIVDRPTGKETVRQVTDIIKRLKDDSNVMYQFYFGQEGINYLRKEDRISLKGVPEPIIGWNGRLFDYYHLKPLYDYVPEKAEVITEPSANSLKSEISKKEYERMAHLRDKPEISTIYRKRMDLWNRELEKLMIPVQNDDLSGINGRYYDFLALFEYMDSYLKELNR